MKKQLIAAAVAGAFALPAMAQVTISGSINTGLENNGQLPNSKFGVVSLGGGANAININATEDLGGGLSAGATFQLRFSAATGDATSSGVANTVASNTFPGANVYHAANLFLSSKAAGTLRIGKVAEDSSCGFDPWGCAGGAAMMAGSGATSNAVGAALRTSLLVGAATQANSVYYQSPAVNGFRLSLQTTMGTRGAAAGTASADLNRINDRVVVNLTYSAGPFSAQYIDVKGAHNTGQARGDDKRAEKGYGLMYNMGVARVSVYKADKQDADGTKTADLTNVSASIPMGTMTVLAGYTKNNASTALATADSKAALGVNYSLSKRTTVGADVYKAEIAGGSTGYVLRARHNF